MFPHATALNPIEFKAAIVRDPIVVSPDTTVSNAIAQMIGLHRTGHVSAGKLADHFPRPDPDLTAAFPEIRLSCVLVVDDGQLVGMMTQWDVLRLSAQKISLDGLVVQQAMTYPVNTLREPAFTDLFSAITLLQQYRVRHLPILDRHDRLMGVVTHESLCQAVRPSDLMRLRQVKDAMTTELVCAAPNTPLIKIAQQMVDHCADAVVLVEPGDDSTNTGPRPVGILIGQDLVQLQGLGLALENCQAGAVMRTLSFEVKPQASFRVVEQMMEQHNTYHLVVTGEQGELLGLVTQSSLLQAFNPVHLYDLAKGLGQKVMRLEAEKVTLLESRNVELEQQIESRTAVLKAKAEREKIVADLAMQIRSSLSLQTILETTVDQVRQLLGCDRVNIWQFDTDWHSVVVAESTDSALSFVGERIDNLWFEPMSVEVYRQGWIQVLPDIDTVDLPDGYRELLIGLQTRTKILVPLLCGDQLWGLLNVIESQYAREWKPEDVELLQALSTHMAIALQQAITHQQLQAELKERRQAEARLRESEQRYASLAAAAPVGIFRFDAAGRCIYVNDRWLQISGFTAEAAMGDGWQDLIYPGDRNRVVRDWAKSIRENKPSQGEYRLQRPDHKLVWVWVQTIAEQNEQGQLMGYVGTVTDISDRKQVEQQLHQLNQALEAKVEERTAALQEREARYRALVDKASDAIVVADLQGNLLEANYKMEALFGYPREQLTQMNQSQLCPPEDLSYFNATFGEVVKGTRTETLNARILRQDGQIVPVDITATRVKIGDTLIIQGIFRDLTERMKSEKALRESQQFLQTVLDSFPLCVFWKDRNSVYLGCNQTFVSTSGFESSDQIIGKTDRDLWPETDAQLYWEDDQQVMESGVPKLEIIKTQLRADGTITWSETNKVPLRDLDGVVIGVLGIYQDISDRKRAEQLIHQAQQQLTERNEELAISNQELARATRLKDEFLANMSHELRTPFNAILGMAEGLQEGVFGAINTDQMKALKSIERSGSHLLEVINDILDVAKIESGHFTLDCTATAVVPLCQSSLTFIKQQALKKHIQLDIKHPRHLPDLWIDERRIRQVLINLLNNAVKFTPEGGRVTLAVSIQAGSGILDGTDTPPQSFLRMAVIDTGIGIAPEYISNLFQPFIQIDSDLSRQYTGTGLGLVLVKRIVELHGGKVGLTSEVGVGSCFTIDLPCVAADVDFCEAEPQDDSSFEPSQPDSIESPLILLAEDNDANIATISSYLRVKGYRLLVVKNGADAIAVAQAETPDLILMDVQMPGMSGLDAIQQIRCDPALSNIPIITLTALAMVGDRESCLAAGANEYLSKPVKLKQLVTTMQQLLSLKPS
ncbi:MAG: PAS domain S-box protein [Cyanobacteria bacterium P01_A01_bin.123]